MIAIVVMVVLAIALVIARTMSDKKQTEKPQEAVDEKWMGAFDAYDKAFNAIKKKPLFALAVGIAMLAGYTFSVVIQGQPEPGQFYIPYEFVFLLPVAVVMPVYSLATADKKTPSFGSLYRRPLRTFVALIFAIILVELLVIASAIAFIIPAIWAVAWFSMVPFVVMDKNIGPIKALKESKRLAQDHIGKVWGLIGVSILLSIVVQVVSFAPYSGKYIGVALSGVFTVWGSVSNAILYRWLQKNVKGVE